jgi:type II secretory pathway pseudopilin PulG
MYEYSTAGPAMRKVCCWGFTNIELLVVIGLLVLVAAILLPLLSHIRNRAYQSSIRAESNYGYAAEMAANNLKQAAAGPASGAAAPPHPLARVSRFDATIALTPKLSVGTAEPESIYETSFSAKVQAVQPRDDVRVCEVELPLPPEIISLTDLSVKADGQPSELVALRDGRLVWRGTLRTEPTDLEIVYTAVGKGCTEAIGVLVAAMAMLSKRERAGTQQPARALSV